jgi:hypothetical protein
MININNLSIVVFSKDRPLQLQGYIESLLFFGKVKQNNITVIYKIDEEFSYVKLTKNYPEIKWIGEVNFYEDLLDCLEQTSEYIMFGCDDVIFKGNIDFAYALNVLSNNDKVFGFSLRLGNNIKPLPNYVETGSIHNVWNWKLSNLSSWNYPWELDSTIYRKTDVIKISKQLKSKQIKNPNYFESEVANATNLYIDRDCLASFKSSKSIVLTVNRVQDNFSNEFDDSLATDIKSLNMVYKNGGKLDFLAISNLPNKRIHVGAEYFKISGSEGYDITFFFYLKKVVRKMQGVLKRFSV